VSAFLILHWEVAFRIYTERKFLRGSYEEGIKSSFLRNKNSKSQNMKERKIYVK
jgi:hypothetical protein